MVLAFSTSFFPLDKIVMYAASCNSSTSFSLTGTGIIAYFLLNFNRVRRTDMAAGKPCKITLSPSASARLNTSASSTASAYLSDPGRSFPDRLGDATAPAVFVGQQFYRLRHGHALPGNVGFHFITAVFRLVSAHIYNSFPFLDSLCGIMDVLDGSTHLPQSVDL